MQVYHPNIDLEGNVCLNILREDWKPVLNINTVIYGLNLLFTVFHLIDTKNEIVVFAIMYLLFCCSSALTLWLEIY